jgi:hypothetical protein
MSIGPTRLNQKAYFVRLSLPVDFFVYESGSATLLDRKSREENNR